MPDSVELEEDIRHLLSEARRVLNAKNINTDEMCDLMRKMLNCADRCAHASLPLSEQYLEQAVEDLEYCLKKADVSLPPDVAAHLMADRLLERSKINRLD